MLGWGGLSNDGQVYDLYQFRTSEARIVNSSIPGTIALNPLEFPIFQSIMIGYDYRIGQGCFHSCDARQERVGVAVL